MRFKDIVGQRDVINRLTQAVDSGRVSHAQMILGPMADGSLQLALAYLQYLCCEHRQHYGEDGGDLRADSCGECPSCKKLASLMHPDLHFVFPNPPNGSTSVSSNDYMADFLTFLKEQKGLGTLDDFNRYLDRDIKTSIIRETDAAKIVADLALKSYEGGWKMMVIWMAEKMNTAAANELLKTLEEPTKGTLLMLVVENDERMLSTIKSRVQTVRLQPVAGDPWAAAREQYAPMLVEWLRMLFKLKMRELSAQVDKMAALGREQQKQMLTYTLQVMRDCFLHGAAALPVNIGSGDQKFDTMFPNMVTANNIEMINNALNEALFAIERNANAKIAFMQLSFNMSKALKKR